MARITGFALALALSMGLTLPLAAQGNDDRPARAKLLEKFDKNGDGKLDQAERETMRATIGDKLRRRRGEQSGPAREGRRGRPGGEKGPIAEGRRGPGGREEAGAGRRLRAGARRDGSGLGARRRAIIDRLDRNDDGRLDQNERQAAKDRFDRQDRQERPGRSRPNMARRFDQNGEGRLRPIEGRLRRHALMHRLLRARQLRFDR